MQERVEKARSTGLDAASAFKYQIIFMVVGIAIIVGGLWFVYEGDAPYHPDDGPMAEFPHQQSSDS